MKKGSKPIDVIKLFLVGDPGAGKTTLKKSLKRVSLGLIYLSIPRPGKNAKYPGNIIKIFLQHETFLTNFDIFLYINDNFSLKL